MAAVRVLIIGYIRTFDLNAEDDKVLNFLGHGAEGFVNP